MITAIGIVALVILSGLIIYKTIEQKKQQKEDDLE